VEELDEDAVESVGMDEGDLAGEAAARLFIDELNTLRLELGELGVDVVRLEADVMEAFAFAFEVASDAGVGHDGFEQLEEGVAEIEERGAHALVLDDLFGKERHAEFVAIERERFVHAVDDDAGVVDAGYGHL
jgi:hypothetical protein